MAKMKFLSLLAAVTVAALLAGGCTAGTPEGLTAFVGSASKPPMEESTEAFEKETGIQVFANYGGSGTMLSQIELSRSGDIYMPGSPDYMVKAESRELIDPASIKKVAYLVPVIAVQRGNPLKIKSLADLARPGVEVAIGNPESVCLGLYAVELLEYNGLLADVAQNIVTNAESCEKLATLLSLKSVDAIIGWDVFQHWDPENIEVVYPEPAYIPRLAYIPAAVSVYASDRAGANRFLDFLVSSPGQEIFRKWGYISTEAEARPFAPAAAIGGEYRLPEGYRDLMKP